MRACRICGVIAGHAGDCTAARAMSVAADTPVVARTLADLATSAYSIADELITAGAGLGDAFEGNRDEAKAKAGALACLLSAQEGIAELIREVEGA